MEAGFTATRKFVDARVLQGHTQASFARRLGVDPSWVSMIESGHVLGPRAARKAAKALGLTTQQAVTDGILNYRNGDSDGPARARAARDKGRAARTVKRRQHRYTGSGKRRTR